MPLLCPVSTEIYNLFYHFHREKYSPTFAGRAGGQKFRLDERGVSRYNKLNYEYHADVAQWQSISLVMRRLWVRFPPSAPKMDICEKQMSIFGFRRFISMLGVGKAAPAQFILRGKMNLRRTRAAGQKAGFAKKTVASGNRLF